MQATLQFVHPDPDITVSYLQALCCAEGTLVDRASLARLYESEHPIDDVDVHDSKVTGITSIFPHFDVRRTINSLQLWLSGSGNPARSAQGIYCDQSLEDLMFSGNVAGASEDADSQSLRAPFHAEFLSYLDSHLVRHPTDSVEVRAIIFLHDTDPYVRSTPRLCGITRRSCPMMTRLATRSLSVLRGL